jgi:hypothetical protein
MLPGAALRIIPIPTERTIITGITSIIIGTTWREEPMGDKRRWRCSNGLPRGRGMTFIRTGQETSIAIQRMDGNGETPAGGRNLALKMSCRLRPKPRQDRGGRSGPVRSKESAPLAQAKRQVPALPAAAPLPWIASSSPGSAVRSVPTVSRVSGEPRENLSP